MIWTNFKEGSKEKKVFPHSAEGASSSLLSLLRLPQPGFLSLSVFFSLCAVCYAKSLQSCPTLCNPMTHSLPGSSVHGILQARILKNTAISYSRGSSQPRDWTHISCISCIGRRIIYHQHHPGSSDIYLCECMLSGFIYVWLYATPWTVACQAQRSMRFSRHKYWSGLPCPPPGDLLDPGIKQASLALAGTSATWEALFSLSTPLQIWSPKYVVSGVLTSHTTT